MRNRLTGTSTFRRLTKRFVGSPLSDTTGKYRQTSRELFRLNPAMAYRFGTWLNRELKVLQDSNDNSLPHVLELIQRLITHFHIRSRRNSILGLWSSTRLEDDLYDGHNQYSMDQTPNVLCHFCHYLENVYENTKRK